jgi:hypothetical protein
MHEHARTHTHTHTHTHRVQQFHCGQQLACMQPKSMGSSEKYIIAARHAMERRASLQHDNFCFDMARGSPSEAMSASTRSAPVVDHSRQILHRSRHYQNQKPTDPTRQEAMREYQRPASGVYLNANGSLLLPGGRKPAKCELD